MKFAYNRAVHSVTHCSLFEAVYDFNPLTPMDLCPLPVSKLVNVDGESKEKYVKQINQQVRNRIEKQNSKVDECMNKGRTRVVFQPGDWVWVHFHKEKLPTKGNLSYMCVEMDHFKSLNASMIMLID